MSGEEVLKKTQLFDQELNEIRIKLIQFQHELETRILPMLEEKMKK